MVGSLSVYNMELRSTYSAASFVANLAGRVPRANIDRCLSATEKSFVISAVGMLRQTAVVGIQVKVHLLIAL